MEASMKIELRCEGYSAPDRLRSHVYRRLGEALGRFRDQVQWARVRLKDVNGPRGGNDKLCLVQLRVKGASDIILQERQVDARSAFDRAAARVMLALFRQIARRRRPQRDRAAMEPTPA
jgi:ribosome-associated translation inhibitor RaiA